MKRLNYRLEGIDLSDPTYRIIHPFGRMPALRDGEFVLYETMAIAAYPDKNYSGISLQPSDTRAKSLMIQWISAINAYFYDALVRDCIQERFLQPLWGHVSDEEKIQGSISTLSTYLAIVNKSMEAQECFTETQTTLAGLFLAPICFYLYRMPECREQIDRFEEVHRWIRRLSQAQPIRDFCFAGES